MTPSPKYPQYLAPKDILRKRPSDEAIGGLEPKKRNMCEARTSLAMASQGPDQPISPDPDDDGTFEQINDLTKKPRVFRMPHGAGESEQSTWAHCCRCENRGLIMSWPQCRLCSHNRCGCCEYSDNEKSTADERADEGPNALERFGKMNELSGEIGLELEALEVDESLTTPQRSGIKKCWEALRSFNELVSDMEDGVSEAARPENTVE